LHITIIAYGNRRGSVRKNLISDFRVQLRKLEQHLNKSSKKLTELIVNDPKVQGIIEKKSK